MRFKLGLYGGTHMGDHWKKKFAVIYTGQAFSLLGSAAVQFAVIWWLTVQTGSAITLTLVHMVRTHHVCNGSGLLRSHPAV